MSQLKYGLAQSFAATKLFNGFISICLATLSVMSSASARPYAVGQTKKLTIKTQDYRAEMKTLVDEGFDISGVNLDDKTIDVIVDEFDLKKISSLNSLRVHRVENIDRSLAPDSKYVNYERLVAALKSHEAAQPGLIKLESYGKSREGRDLIAVRISDDTVSGPKPVVFFNAMHHAREVMTTEIALDLVDVLAKGYAENDEQIRNWVQSNEIWVIPMVNPDGNNKVWTSDSMWRKNTRPPYGVDINRNYPYKWGSCSGSSGSEYAQDYRGPSAASEPETQAVMAFVERIRPVMSISYHSYSELVLYPMSCQGEHAPDQANVSAIGQKLASLLKKDTGSGTYKPGTPWEILYGVDGGDIDWLYDTYDVMPFAIEVNGSMQGFQPSYSWRQKTVEKMRPGWKYFLDRVSQSGVRAVVKNSVGRAVTEGSITVESLGTQNLDGVINKVYKVKPDGTFHLILQPGMYRLHVVSGQRSTDVDVTIGAERSDLEIAI